MPPPHLDELAVLRLALAREAADEGGPQREAGDSLPQRGQQLARVVLHVWGVGWEGRGGGTDGWGKEWEGGGGKGEGMRSRRVASLRVWSCPGGWVGAEGRRREGRDA